MSGQPRVKIYLTNFLLVISSTSLSLIVAEGFFRIIFDPVDYVMPYLVPDDALGYKIEPNSAGHDSWGYRNKSVPARADIVAIGDSQTYGISATANNSWPAILQRLTGKDVHNLSLGGYGPVEYFYLLENKAFKLHPSLVIVGFYYGNDLKDAYDIVYRNPYWKYLRRPEFTPDQGMSPKVLSSNINSQNKFVRYAWELRDWFAHHSVLYRVIVEALPIGDIIRFSGMKYLYADDNDIIIFEDAEHNIHTGFTPAARLSVLNLNDPKIQEGLRLSLEMLHQMNELCINKKDTDFLVVLIPTKESVFAQYIEKNRSLRNSQIIDELLMNERSVNESVKADFEEHHIAYIDVVDPLRNVVGKEQIYPTNENGHPNKNGYRIIAETIQQYLAKTSKIN